MIQKHLDHAIESYMPHVKQIVTPLSHNQLGKGYMCPISTVFPTCPRSNQVSIVTGLTPDNHGIVGDYCIDGGGTDSDSLFANSILTELSHDSVNVLFMSISDQFREQLTYDFHPNSTSLSLESLIKYSHHIDNPDSVNVSDTFRDIFHLIWDDDKSYMKLKDISANYFKDGEIDTMKDSKGESGLFLLEIMRKIMESDKIETPLLNYVALSPATIQYYHDHRSPEMMHFLKEVDVYLKYFDDKECRYGLTSSHGTNYKLGAKGDIAVINVERKITECWIEYGKQMEKDIFALFEYEVILQRNEGDVLYGFAHIHIMGKDENVDEELKRKLIFYTLGYLRDLKGIYSSIGHDEACSSLELPTERIGDVLLLGDIDTLFCDNEYEERNQDGKNKKQWRLSHGCLDESTVPLILNERPTDSYLTMLGKGKGRNYHLLDILLNGYDENLQDQCPYKYTPSKYQYVGK